MTPPADMRRPELRVTTELLPDHTGVLVLEGEVDLYTQPVLERELSALLEQGVERVVIELDQTDFVDSTLVGVLVEFSEKLPGGGGAAVVSNETWIRKMFVLTRLDGPLRLSTTREEALERLAASGAGR